MTHICDSILSKIGSDNALSPGRQQAIFLTNDWILLIEPLGANCSEIVIESHIYSFKKMNLNMWSGKWAQICLGLDMFKKQCSRGVWIYWIHSPFWVWIWIAVLQEVHTISACFVVLRSAVVIISLSMGYLFEPDWRHTCVSKWTIIGSYNGLVPVRCQAIIWTNDVLWWNIVNLHTRNKLQIHL